MTAEELIAQLREAIGGSTLFLQKDADGAYSLLRDADGSVRIPDNAHLELALVVSLPEKEQPEPTPAEKK